MKYKIELVIIVLFVFITASFGCIQTNQDNNTSKENSATIVINDSEGWIKLPDGTQKTKIEYSFDKGTVTIYTLNHTPSFEEMANNTINRQISGKIDSKTIKNNSGTTELNAIGAKSILISGPNTKGTFKIIMI